MELQAEETTQDDVIIPPVMQYGTLHEKHPDWKGPYWKILHALAEGGHKVTASKAVLEELLPQKSHEHQTIYEQRKKRAVYIPYSGEIIGEITTLLGQDPAVLTVSGSDTLDSLDPFWTDFVDGVDGGTQTLTQYAQEVARCALIHQDSWTLVNLPEVTEDDSQEAPINLKSQDELGQRRVTLTVLDTNSVIDWEADDDGELRWAVTCTSTKPRLQPGAKRNVTLERYTFWTRTGWYRFDVTYNDTEGVPDDLKEIRMAKSGAHSFGRVPLLRFSLPCGLWAMDKIFSIIRAHFMERSGLSWLQEKALFPILAAFLGPEQASAGGTTPSEAQTDPNRATAQVYGPGYVNRFGKDDDLKFIGPSTEPAQFAAQDLKVLRDEMHRVVHMMALSLDSESPLIGRSEGSRIIDEAEKNAVVKEIGRLLKVYIKKILETAARGRQEGVEPDWLVKGLAEIDSTPPFDASGNPIEDNIPSKTVLRTYWVRKARWMTKGMLTEDEQAQAEKEINDWVDRMDDAVQPGPPPWAPVVPPAPGGAGAPGGGSIPGEKAGGPPKPPPVK